MIRGGLLSRASPAGLRDARGIRPFGNKGQTPECSGSCLPSLRLPVRSNTLPVQRFFLASQPTRERAEAGYGRERPPFQRLVRHGEVRSVPGLVALTATRGRGRSRLGSSLWEGPEAKGLGGSPRSTVVRTVVGLGGGVDWGAHHSPTMMPAAIAAARQAG